jgi:hypothetical protein
MWKRIVPRVAGMARRRVEAIPRSCSQQTWTTTAAMRFATNVIWWGKRSSCATDDAMVISNRAIE